MRPWTDTEARPRRRLATLRTEIDREPELLSRERGKAATLIEGAADRNDVYKTVETSIETLASKHLNVIVGSVREIRRQDVGEEVAAQEERNGNKTDDDYMAVVKAKRDEREKAHEEAMRKQKEIEPRQIQLVHRKGSKFDFG